MKKEYVTRLHYSSTMGIKVEPNLTSSVAEGNQSSLLGVDDKNNVAYVNNVYNI